MTNLALKTLSCGLLMLLVISCKSADGSQRNCTHQYVYGLNVQVQDAATGESILNDVSVTVTEGSYTEELSLNVDTFIGAGERPGNYIIEVVANGYVPYISQIIAVGGDECHVITKSVAIELQPI